MLNLFKIPHCQFCTKTARNVRYVLFGKNSGVSPYFWFIIGAQIILSEVEAETERQRIDQVMMTVKRTNRHKLKLSQTSGFGGNFTVRRMETSKSHSNAGKILNQPCITGNQLKEYILKT